MKKALLLHRKTFSFVGVAGLPLVILIWGDLKEKALPRCAWLGTFFIHAFIQVEPATL
jgi:hypothetical protein